MDTAKQLYDYVSADRDNRFMKLNEEGKKVYLQYGYSKGLIKDNELTDVSRKYISGIKSPTDNRKMMNEQRLEGITPQAKPAVKANALGRSQERYINPELGRSDAVLAGLLGGLSLGAVGKGDSDFEKLQQEHPIAHGAGYIAGMSAPFSGVSKVTQPLTNLVTNKIKNEVGKRAVSGIIPGALVDVATGAIAGERGTDLAKRVGEGAVLGAAGDVAFYGLGKVTQGIFKKLGENATKETAQAELENMFKQGAVDGEQKQKAWQELEDYYNTVAYLDEVNRSDPKYIKSEARMSVPKAKTIKTAVQDIELQPDIPSKGKSYKVVNTNYNKAVDEFNKAIETIQNFYGTNELRTDEYARVKTDLGIDLDKLIANIEAAKAPNISRIGERERLKAVAGLKDLPDIAKVETIPQQAKPNRSIIEILGDRVNGVTKQNAQEGSTIVQNLNGGTSTPPKAENVVTGQADKRKLLDMDFDKIDDTTEISNTIKSLEQYKTEIQAKMQTAKPEEMEKYRTELLKIDLQLFSAQKKLEPLKIRQANTAAEKPFGKAPLTGQTPEKPHGNADILKDIDNDLEGAPVKSNPEIAAIAPTLKDTKLGISYQLTDVYRNFKHAFGKNYDNVKKAILDPFDKAKKSYVDTQKTYTDDLYNNVVKKLGIGKDTKLSKAVQEYGEGKKYMGVQTIADPQSGKKIKVAKMVDYTLDDLKKDFPDKWQDIVEADKWFRNAYDKLIDQVNTSRRQIYPNNPEKLVPKRNDYYRHFREMADTIEGVKNLFDTPANIDPKLVGVSEYTQPKSKWASFMQQRGMGVYKADAVGGFLDYIKAASYAINIDPQINVFRGLAKDIAKATGDSKNANNFILFLRNFANDLAGKTSTRDRSLQDDFNRKIFKVLNWANSRVKKNTVLYNLRSAMSQLANVPQVIAKIKNPVSLTKGFGDTAAGVLGQGKAPELYKQSQFLSERYVGKLYSRFNTKWLEQPEKFASWLLETADAAGTKFIWNSAYNDAIAKKAADPIKYADDLTRSLIAGRGIGEVPLMQKSKVFQLVAPFQLEVTNLWHVMRDMVDEKDFGGIATLFVLNYLFNEGMENLTGSGVTFDPIGAMHDALKEDVSPGQVAGRLGGEVLSNMPLGQTIAAQLPEDVRTKYMGDNDPTRFGTGLLLTKGLQDPLAKLVAPGGGAQIKKTYEAAKALTEDVPGVYGKNKEGEYLKYLVNKGDVGNVLKGLIFGKSAFNEAQEYYGTNARPLSADQTKLLLKLAEQGRDPKDTYDKMMLKRKINSLDTLIKNSRKDGVTDKEKAKIDQAISTIRELMKQ